MVKAPSLQEIYFTIPRFPLRGEQLKGKKLKIGVKCLWRILKLGYTLCNLLLQGTDFKIPYICINRRRKKIENRCVVLQVVFFCYAVLLIGIKKLLQWITYVNTK